MRHGKDGQMHEVIDYKTGEAMPDNPRYAEMLSVFNNAGVPTEEIQMLQDKQMFGISALIKMVRSSGYAENLFRQAHEPEGIGKGC